MFSLQDLPKIDAHIHFNANRDNLLELAEEYGFSLLTINTEVPDFPSITKQRQLAQHRQSSSKPYLFHATTISTQNIFEEDWAEQTIDKIEHDISEGACGVKFWKNIGMSIQRDDGSFLMLDDKELEPIFNFLEEQKITVLGHQGEPKNCWLPVEEMTVQSDRDYFSHHPQYHMYKHDEYPDYWRHIEARDHILERHPNLNFIGLHLGSLEWSLEEVTKRLIQFPNFAVDLAERINHLYYHAAEDRSNVIQFFERFQDRIIYGTDIIDDPNQQPGAIIEDLTNRWESHWKFLSTDKSLNSPEITQSFRGLGLSQNILEKIYRENTLDCYNISDQF